MGHKTNLPAAGNESPRRGDRVAAKHIQSLTNQVKRLSRRGQESYASAFPNVIQPFMPTVQRDPSDSSKYLISITRGIVIESKIVGDFAVVEHIPENMLDAEDKPIWHPIDSGECLYIQVDVGAEGEIQEPVNVIIDSDDKEGVHYIPKMFLYGGRAGTHYFKICKFTVEDGLELFCAGNNIHHYPERMAFESMDVSGDIYPVGKTYLPDEDLIQFRPLLQLDGDGETIINPFTGAEEDADSIDFKRIKHLSTSNQITVSSEGNSILIRGNNNNGTLTHQDCEDPPTSTVLLEWMDGLIISSSATFVAGCGGGSSSGGGGMV